MILYCFFFHHNTKINAYHRKKVDVCASWRKIKLLRIEKGLTQDDLSRKLNGSSQAISNWERQKGYPDISNIIQLSDLFNVSLDDLIKEILILKNNC